MGPPHTAMAGSRNQADFLRQLLSFYGVPERGELGDRMEAADRDIQSMYRACRAVGIMAGFCLAGLGYCAVLLPDFFASTTPPAVRVLRILTLGCGLSFLGFWGMSRWYAAAREQLHDRARQLVLQAVRAGTVESLPVLGASVGSGRDGKQSPGGTEAGAVEGDGKVIPLRQAC